MQLLELAPVAALVLPIAGLKDHLRLGSAFALADDQDGLLEAHLRAALAVIEGRISKALLSRNFQLELEQCDWGEALPLPLAPISSVEAVRFYTAEGAETLLDAQDYRLIADLHRPKLRLYRQGHWSAEARLQVEFTAGFGADWADLPFDLQQAVLLLAAQFYEARHSDQPGAEAVPRRVAGLIERWRLVRLLGGGRG